MSTNQMTLKEIEEKIKSYENSILLYGPIRECGECFDDAWHEAVAGKRRMLDMKKNLKQDNHD